MKKISLAHSVIGFLFFSLLLLGAAWLSTTQFDASTQTMTSVQEVAQQTPEFKLEQLGFQARLQNGKWRWQYAHKMRNGCEKLLFRNDPVHINAENEIKVELKTYQTDEICTLPPVTQIVRGGIAAPSNSKFMVLLDEEQVYP